jgi:hypothetical protein
MNEDRRDDRTVVIASVDEEIYTFIRDDELENEIARN